MKIISPNLSIINIEDIRRLLRDGHIIIRETQNIQDGRNYLILKGKCYEYEIINPNKVLEVLIYPNTFKEFLDMAKDCDCKLSTRLKRCKDYKRLIKNVCSKPFKRYKALVKISQNIFRTKDYRITLFRTHGLNNYFVWFLNEWLDRNIQECYKNRSVEDYDKPINRLSYSKFLAEHVMITALPYL